LQLSSRQSSKTTLLTVLRSHASARPEHRLYTLLGGDGRELGAITFEALELQSRRIAAALQAVARRGERAVLLYAPGLDYITGLLGTMQAGLLAVPAYPPDPTRLERTLPRLRAIVEDAQASVILTTSQIVAVSEAFGGREPELRGLRWVATDTIPTGAEAEWRDPGVCADDLAILQYTSGSTGSPRGVMLSHSNLLSNLALITGNFQADASCTQVSWLPPYHDMGLIGGILAPLYVAAHSVLMQPLDFLRQPALWLQAITRYRATHCGSPNFGYELCNKRVSPEQRAGLELSSWRLAFCGAEPINPRVVERFCDGFAPYGFARGAFLASYGLAEATLHVTSRPHGSGPLVLGMQSEALERGRAVPAVGDAARRIVSCGRPGAGVEVAIVEPSSRRRCDPGEVGEIWLRSPSVASGYWNQPERSAATFQAYMATGEGPYLRTGDLGFECDGELFVAGRLKDLIVIRGRNLYPQDLESTASDSHPALRAGCAIAFAIDVDDEEHLVVVQEVDPRRSTNFDEMTAAIRRDIAEQHGVQPHAVVLLAPGALFKTTSGKVQRQASRRAFLDRTLTPLAQWQAQPEARAVPPDAEPRTRTEQVLADLWCELLAVRGVSRSDNFFACGGHSVLAIQVAWRASQATGVHVPVSAIFEWPVLADLADYMDRAERQWQLPPLRPAARDQRVPLSFSQEQLWMAQTLAPAGRAYNLSAGLCLRGALDLNVMVRALAGLVNRHEILRMYVELHDGRPYLAIAEQLPVALVDEDLRSLPADQRATELARRLEDQASAPFDLGQAPLFRMASFRTADDEAVLALTLHHITCDGWSINLLLSDLAALYNALLAGSTPSLPAATTRYADVAVWQRTWMAGEVLDRHIDHFVRRLSGDLPVLALPLDHPRTHCITGAGATVVQPFEPELGAAIEHLGKTLGATLHMTLLAGFLVLLHGYSRQEDLILGTTVAGRVLPEMEPVVGCFINNLVLRFDLQAKPSFRELVAQVRGESLAAYDHQTLPFEKLLEVLNPRREPGVSPLFQVVFGVQNTAQESLAFTGLDFEWLRPASEVARYDLTVWIEPSPKRLQVTWTYRSELFERATIEDMAEAYRAILHRAAADPDLGVATLAMASRADHDRRAVRQQALGDSLRRIKRRSSAIDEIG
jgi:acyl-CoA synthetase (AMP-forming)/AMP-acid ligase II